MIDPDQVTRDLEAAAHTAVPWSSDPLDDVEWVRDPDGTVHVYPSGDQ